MSDNIIQTLPDGRMSSKQAAEYLGFNPGTMNNWRLIGYGPRFQKIGRKVFYHLNDLKAWVESQGFCRTTTQALLQRGLE